MSDLDAWNRLMADRFPFVTDDRSASLEFVEGQLPEDETALRAVIRLITWEVDGDQRNIRDVKEQHVAAGNAQNLEYLDRYGEFLDALQRAFADFTGETVMVCMPDDFVPSDVLDLQIRTAEEFYDALMAKSRLGGLPERAAEWREQWQ